MHSRQTIVAVANAFSAILREWLTSEQLTELNERNREYIANGVDFCESHDYCDPNAAMISAYEQVTGTEWVGIDDDCMSLCGLAWDAAKRAGFAEIVEDQI